MSFNRPRRDYGISFDCEICGRQNATGIALIEGAKMAVCQSCSKFGKITHQFDLGGNKPANIDLSPQQIDEVVEGYGKLIRNSREKLGLSLKEMAHKLQEQESYLEKIENEKLLPRMETANKLEKALKIKLIQKAAAEHVNSVKKENFTGPTLGDGLIINKK